MEGLGQSIGFLTLSIQTMNILLNYAENCTKNAFIKRPESLMLQ
jgi:hypothetical protein